MVWPEDSGLETKLEDVVVWRSLPFSFLPAASNSIFLAMLEPPVRIFFEPNLLVFSGDVDVMVGLSIGETGVEVEGACFKMGAGVSWFLGDSSVSISSES